MDEAFFRQLYEADDDNRARQSWDDYAGWVAAFYQGKRFPPVPGWARRRDELASRIHGDHRPEVTARLDDVGRILAGEWAKDNTVRQVTTDQLKAYGRLLEEAAKADGGDGGQLLAAADAIEADIARRTGRPGSF